MIEAIIVVAVLVIVGGVGYLYFTKNPDKVSLPKKDRSPSSEVSAEMELHIPEVIESEAVIQEPNHEVVQTWIGRSSIGDTYHWKCSCGVNEYTYVRNIAADRARRHVTDKNRELEMLRKSNGHFGW